MRAATLAKSRGTIVAREQIGITLGIGPITRRVIPGAGWQGDDARSNMRTDVGPGPAGSAGIKYSYQVTIVNATLTGVSNINLYCARTGTRYICDGTFHLTMQFIAGLRRYQVQRKLLCQIRAKPFFRH